MISVVIPTTAGSYDLKVVAVSIFGNRDLSTSGNTTYFTASYLPIIINEVAWAGTNASPYAEWIELKNISGNTHSLNGWQLIGEKNDVQIMFDADTKTTKASPLFLLERTDNNSAPAVDADIIYQGALSQKNDGLRLFDNEGDREGERDIDKLGDKLGESDGDKEELKLGLNEGDIEDDGDKLGDKLADNENDSD